MIPKLTIFPKKHKQTEDSGDQSLRLMNAIQKKKLALFRINAVCKFKKTNLSYQLIKNAEKNINGSISECRK